LTAGALYLQAALSGPAPVRLFVWLNHTLFNQFGKRIFAPTARILTVATGFYSLTIRLFRNGCWIKDKER
jgi:hypothetical protein